MDAQYDATSASDLSTDDPTDDDSLSQTFAGGFGRLWQEERHWLIVLIPLLLTLVVPIQWMIHATSILSDPLSFQPLVWLGVLYLAWSERYVIASVYRGNAAIYPPESKQRRGTPLIFYFGCTLLVLSYITTLSAIAIAGFLVTVAGALLYLYGFAVVRTLWRPALLSLTMIPIPGTVMEMVIGRIQAGEAAIAGAILKLFYSQTIISGNFISVSNYTAQVSGASNGLGMLLPTVVLTLFLALLRQIRFSITLILLGSAAGITLIINTLRIVSTGLIGMQNKALADMLQDAHPWFFVIPCFYLVYLLAGRIGPRTYYMDEEDEE